MVNFAGYYKAPVSKAAMIFGVAGVLLNRSFNLNKAFQLDHSAVFYDRQVWRILTFQLLPDTIPEALVLLFTIHQFRQLERQMGSAKFASIIFISLVVSALLCAGMLGVFPGLGRVASGPIAAAFALLPFFYKYIPRADSGRSYEKVMVYLGGLQLLLSSGFPSIIPGTAGLLFGALSISGTFGVSQWRIPAAVRGVVKTVAMPVLGSTRPGDARMQRHARVNRRENADAEAFMRQQMEQLRMMQAEAGAFGGGGGGAPPYAQQAPQAQQQQAQGQGANMTQFGLPRIAEPDNAAVERVVAMGFERSKVEDALAACDNNQDAAVELLLRSV